MDAPTGRPCAATTRTGRPCRSYAVNDSDFCYWHDPGLSAERQAANIRGGHARHGRAIGTTGDVAPVKIDSQAAVIAVLEGELNVVLSLEKSISRARCVGYLCGIASGIYQASELEMRLQRLEEQAAGRAQ